MDWVALLIEMGLNLLTTAFAYLLVPIIFALSSKKLKAKTIRWISIINSVVVWLLFRILEISLGNEPSTGAAVFLWGAAGYWILHKNCLKRETPSSEITAQPDPQSPSTHMSLSGENEPPRAHRRNAIYGSDIMLEQELESQMEGVVQPSERPSYEDSIGFNVASVDYPTNQSLSRTDDPNTSPSKPEKRRNSKAGRIVLSIVSWTLVAISISALAISLYRNYELEAQNSEQLTQISNLQKRVDNLAEKNEAYTETISDLKVKASAFDNAAAFLKNGNIGYASDNFYADESVIVVRKNEQGRKFTLTANWIGGGTVKTDYSNIAATVEFDNESWETSTTITVNPRSVGATVVTFSNDVNNDKFRILIIVTE